MSSPSSSPSSSSHLTAGGGGGGGGSQRFGFYANAARATLSSALAIALPTAAVYSRHASAANEPSAIYELGDSLSSSDGFRTTYKQQQQQSQQPKSDSGASDYNGGGGYDQVPTSSTYHQQQQQQQWNCSEGTRLLRRDQQSPPSQSSSRPGGVGDAGTGGGYGAYNESVQLVKRSSTVESDAFEDYGASGHKRHHSSISAWEASWNISNSIQGMFVIGFPFAVLEGGYYALLGILGLGAVGCYTGQILVDCLYEMDGMGTKMRVRRSYAEVAAVCFGARLGPALVDFSQLLELLMTCVIYLVLCGDLFSDSFPELGFTIYTWILFSGLLVVPYAFLHNIKHLAWISAMCMIVHCAMMVVILGYCLVHISEWQWNAVSLRLDVKSVALALGLILSSNVAQIFLPLTEENMTQPKQFWPMLKWTFISASLMKLVFAWIPFLTFGDQTHEAITNNLPGANMKRFVNLILIIKALLTYPLPYFTSVEILGDIFFSSTERSQGEAIFPSCYSDMSSGEPRLKPWAILARTGLIIGTLLVALFVPHFAILMSFIGSFTGTMLALVWPCMFHLKMKRATLSYWIMAFDVIVIAFGIACCVVGMISSGIALADKY